MPPKIPLVVTIDEANALVDVWEALNHEGAELSSNRYAAALELVDWLRRSVSAAGKPTRYSFLQQLQFTLLNWRLTAKFRLLKWRNRHAVHTLMLTREERKSLLRFLVVREVNADLYPVIERLKEVDGASG